MNGSDRVDIIADTVMNHGTVTGGSCRCGYVYRLGESIPLHKANMIDIALTEAGAW